MTEIVINQSFFLLRNGVKAYVVYLTYGMLSEPKTFFKDLNIYYLRIKIILRIQNCLYYIYKKGCMMITW